MATFSRLLIIDDTSGSTDASVADNFRSEIMVYNYGPDDVYVNFNEISNDSCFKVAALVGIVFTGQKAKMNMLLACSSGETAEVGIVDYPF